MDNNTKDMLGRSGLCPVDKALSILLDSLNGHSKEKEIITLPKALNRILAEDLKSPEDLPLHPRSTMDGYAVKATDTFGASQSTPAYLNVSGEVMMGEMAKGIVEKGSSFKIPTGGLLPEGADAVVMYENTVPVDDTLIEVVKDVGQGTAVIQKGEDIKENASVLKKGVKIHPHDLGLLAGLGITEVNVFKKVNVGILSTGDEIVPYTETPLPGQIRDINSIALAGLVENCGATCNQIGIVSDKKDIFFPMLKKAVEENDIVLFSGGSSVGMRDLGEQAIEELGSPGILVHGVALKPGKPVIIGLHENKPIFGLPGHPVSALVCFNTFAAPAIKSLSGEQIQQTESFTPTVTAELTRNMNSAPGRLDVIRVRLIEEEGTIKADPVMGKSGSISTLSKADGYFLIDEASQGVYQGSKIEVITYK